MGVEFNGEHIPAYCYYYVYVTGIAYKNIFSELSRGVAS